MRQQDETQLLRTPLSLGAQTGKADQDVRLTAIQGRPVQCDMSHYQSNQDYGRGYAQQYQTGCRETIAVDLDDVLWWGKATKGQ